MYNNSSNTLNWDPIKKKYKKLCLECGNEFFGRLNKDFCSEPCKNKHNNDKRRSRMLPLKEHINNIIKNYQLLEEFYPYSLGEKKVNIKLLTYAGFNDKAFEKKIKDKYTGHEYFQVGNYAFRLVDSENVIINQLKH